MAAFTLFNCGTGYGRDSHDVVADLNRLTTSASHINDGVGARLTGGAAHNPGDTNRLAGAIFGVGMDANVATAINAIRTNLRVDPGMSINMVGWSRGAVTCFKVANALHASGTPSEKNIPVRIFAIDPVPGSVGWGNRHMWQHIEITPNVTDCLTIFAQHERRREFAPVFPSPLPTTCTYTPLVMPGTHSSIVERKPKLEDAYSLVMDLAKAFVRARGTTLSDASKLSRTRIIYIYSMIGHNFRNYQAAGEAQGGKKRAFGSTDRSVKSQDETGETVFKLSAEKPPFFINAHHDAVFRSKYPLLHAELHWIPAFAFNAARSLGWRREFDELARKDSMTAGVVHAYAQRIGKTI